MPQIWTVSLSRSSNRAIVEGCGYARFRQIQNGEDPDRILVMRSDSLTLVQSLVEDINQKLHWLVWRNASGFAWVRPEFVTQNKWPLPKKQKSGFGTAYLLGYHQSVPNDIVALAGYREYQRAMEMVNILNGR